MAGTLPSLIVTGASGIVGRSFLQATQDSFRLFAIARRPQSSVGVPRHPNLRWIQVDIGNDEALSRVTEHIAEQGGADYLLHLAAHYDFENEPRPEFEHTNINGTRNVLEQASRLEIEHFIFASSVAACEFPSPDSAITEQSAPDADFPYAHSKRIGEEMVKRYSDRFICSIVRLAAVFSDWCEYAPLYVFLSTWLSSSWNSRILGGRGQSAVPFIHTRDLNRLFLTLLRRGHELSPHGTYIASPDGATSHLQLYRLATRFHFGKAVEPVLMPRPLAWAGVVARDLLGKLIGNRPFERPWMMEYLDRSLTIDASSTRQVLDWQPTPRFHILRPLPFLIEKMVSKHREWVDRNEFAMKRPPERPALVIHDAMLQAREAIVDAIAAYLQSPVRHSRFPNYTHMDGQELRWHIGLIYGLLTAAVRTGDRTPLSYLAKPFTDYFTKAMRES